MVDAAFHGVFPYLVSPVSRGLVESHCSKMGISWLGD